MTIHKHARITTLAAAAMLLAAFAARSHAQSLLPFGPANYQHDFQLFAPVELDLDNAPQENDYGYFASYDKLVWSFIGERHTMGDPNVEVFSEIIYYDHFNTEGTRPNPYPIINGLQDVVPDAGFAWGDRYEVGYRDRGNGWKIGILDGPELNQNQIHGMSDVAVNPAVPFPQQDGGALPPLDPDYLPEFETADPGDRAFGFGNVHINFATPPGFLFGFRDYLNFAADALIGTQGGPILYVGNYGRVDEADQDDDDITIPFFRLTDDLDGDGIPGSLPIPVIIMLPDGTLVGSFTAYTDFDDLHLFNIAFDQVVVRTTTETNGVEAMWTHELTNRHYQAKRQNNRLELGFGARFLKLYDRFHFTADGGVLGRTFSETAIDNQIVGPQVAARWTNQRQRWRLTADARFLFGYNVQDWDQINGIGEELIPGATNRLLYGQPTYSHYGLQQEDFSPVGELRVDAAYYLTESVALKFGYTGHFVGNIRRAAPSVRYFLPDMGYQEAGTQDLIVNGFNFGVEIIH